MDKTRVMIVTPSMDGKPWFGYEYSLIGLLRKLNYTVRVLAENSCISQARALLAQDFEESSADIMFMIDSDIGWDLQGFKRVLDHPGDVAAAAYPARKAPTQFVIRGLEREGTQLVCRGIGAGFMKVTRRALKEMKLAYPDLRALCTDRMAHMLWDPLIVQEQGIRISLTEDLAFCERWCALNHKIFVIPDVTLKHMGNQMFEGNLAKELGKGLFAQSFKKEKDYYGTAKQ